MRSLLATVWQHTRLTPGFIDDTNLPCCSKGKQHTWQGDNFSYRVAEQAFTITHGRYL